MFPKCFPTALFWLQHLRLKSRNNGGGFERQSFDRSRDVFKSSVQEKVDRNTLNSEEDQSARDAFHRDYAQMSMRNGTSDLTSGKERVKIGVFSTLNSSS